MRPRARTATAAVTLLPLLLAGGTQAAPPTPGAGCDPPPTASDEAPSATLPQVGRLRRSSGRVGIVITATQSTGATILARLASTGERVDGTVRGGTCTRPGSSTVAFDVRDRVQRRLRRAEDRVRLRVTLRMTNGSGRTASVSRVVVVRPTGT